MYLVDTNVWLELLLEQQRAAEVYQFLESVDAGQLSMTEFALNSIGLITTRLRKQDVFEAFVSDILEILQSGVFASLPLTSKEFSPS